MLLLDLGNDLLKGSILFSGGGWYAPVCIKGFSDKGTANIAAHGDHKIWPRGLIDIYPIQLFDDPDGIMVDLRFQLCAGGVTFQSVSIEKISDGLCQLTSAGIGSCTQIKATFFIMTPRFFIATFPGECSLK